MPQQPQPASRQVTDTTADAVNLNATRAEPTRPEDASYKPLEGLPSTSLEGRRTGASDELCAEVPVDESTTTQPTWTPRDEGSSGEVHGVANNHEGAAGDEVEGGEVTRMTKDDERREGTSTDASTPAPRKPSMPPEGREGQDTTSNAGAGVQHPSSMQTDSPRRRDGATTSARMSAQSAEHVDNTNADRRQQREDAHERGGEEGVEARSRANATVNSQAEEAPQDLPEPAEPPRRRGRLKTRPRRVSNPRRTYQVIRPHQC